MVIEYIERGQVMVCDESTMTFYSPITSKYYSDVLYIEMILDEDTARRYLLDIISGLKYRIESDRCDYYSSSSQGGPSRH